MSQGDLLEVEAVCLWSRENCAECANREVCPLKNEGCAGWYYVPVEDDAEKEA